MNKQLKIVTTSIIIGLVGLIMSIHVIKPNNHIGVVYNNFKEKPTIVGNVLEEGIHVVAPWYSVIEIEK